MRKITQDAIKALYENKNFKRDNTIVRGHLSPITDGVHIYQKDFTWYLNDRQWKGDWVSVEAFTKYGRYLFD